MKSLRERFETKYERGPACWVWTASRNSNGYGQIGRGPAGAGNWQAHRAAWVLEYGPIPDGVCVLHRCDNPLCVRPDHLFLGTHKDNSQDMVRKGRHALHGKGAHSGERHHLAKITDATAREIRSSPETGRAMASRLGLSEAQVSRIRTGRRWAHLR